MTDDKTTDPVREASRTVAERVGAILGAAEEEAARMRREAHEEVAAVRLQTQKDVAVHTAELTREIESMKSEAATDAQNLRDEAERYAVDQVRASRERAAKVVSDATRYAQERHASAEETARLVDEAGRKHTALAEAANVLEERLRTAMEERLHAAQQGLEGLASDLGELLGEKRAGDEVSEMAEAR